MNKYRNDPDYGDYQYDSKVDAELDRYEETADRDHDERVERSLWEQKGDRARLHRTDREEPLEGLLDVERETFTTASGSVFHITPTERWDGYKFLVWGTGELIGEVRRLAESD